MERPFNLKFDDTLTGHAESSFKLERISPSMMGTYTSCPLAFYYGYIAKIEIPQSRLHLLFGSAIHLALEYMYNDGKDPHETFAEHFKREDLDPEGQLSFSEYYMLGVEMVKNYVDAKPAIDAAYGLDKADTELKVKEFITHPITGKQSSVKFSGILDVLTHGHKIVDYKTSKTKWKTSEARFKLQSRMYNLWYLSRFGKIADETVWIILLKKFKKTSRDEVIQFLSYKPSIDDLAATFEEMEAIVEKIETGNFERPTKGHPPYCDCYKYERYLGITS